MFKEFHSSDILLFFNKNFFRDSKIKPKDFNNNDDWPKIIIGLAEFLIFSERSWLSSDIFLIVSEFLDDPERIKTQVKKTQLIINNLKTQKNSSVQVATALNKFLN